VASRKPEQGITDAISSRDLTANEGVSFVPKGQKGTCSAEFRGVGAVAVFPASDAESAECRLISQMSLSASNI
jgi:hypothetical protein